MNKPTSKAPEAFRLALVLGLGIGSAFAQPTTSATTTTSTPAATTATADSDKQPEKMEKYSVTGSRIKRIDTETPQPVFRLSEADFAATGFSTLGDAIRSIPAISGQSLVSTNSGTSFTPGVSSFNLRGLGNNDTLVLVNGRRAAPYASAGFNGFQTVFDFNSIPTAAVESIEVLKDGASAIYGSDAVAGVVNITLKKNYQGLMTQASFGNTAHTDSNERTAFLIAGVHSGKLSIVTTFDYRSRASMYAHDLVFAQYADGTPYGGINQNSTSTPIAGVRGLVDRVRFPAGTATFATPQSAPTLAAAIPGIPLYNPQELAGWTPDERAFGGYTRLTFDFSDALTGFAEISFRHNEIKIDSAPTPYSATAEIGDSANGTGILPATNPFNPFGQDITDVRWRMRELGNRVQDVVTDSPRVVLGLEGKLPISDWTWNGAVLYSKSTVDQQSRNSSSDRLVQAAFNGVVLNGVKKYANPFGPNDPDIINYLRVNNPGHDEFETRSADLSFTGTVFTLPAGDVGLALGAEERTEHLENLGTELNRDSQIVGGSAGSDTVGSRRLNSFYGELSIPLLKNLPFAKNLELQLAARHEDYSDFGKTTKPKVALVYQPFPELLLRGSYGKSFLAPNLAYLYTTQSSSFTSATLADPLRPQDPRVQIKQIGGGNPLLQPEDTTVKYAGLVLQPFARASSKLFRDLSIGVDYYRFDQKNLIDRLSAAQILANPTFYPLVQRLPPVAGETVGVITSVSATWQNLSKGKYDGYDFDVRWVIPKSDTLGQFRIDLAATYTANQEITSATGVLIDEDGEYSFPQFRANGTLAWNLGNWGASIFITRIGQYNDNFGLAHVSAQTLVNPQVSYKGFFGTTLTVGARNIFDKDPPRDLSSSSLVNINTNFAEPLFWYMRISKEF